MRNEAFGFKNKSALGIIGRIALIAALVFLSVTMALPFIWMLSASLKNDIDVFTFPIQWIPTKPRWQNYVTIWERFSMLTYFINSAKLSIIITLIQLVTSSFAAYAFAKIPFKGRNVLFLAYIGTIAVPWQVYMLPQYMIMSNWGLVNSHTALILLQAFTAFGVFLMRQHYMGIPDSLSEAARIDGLSEYGIYLRIMLPLSKSALASLSIITFVNTWNDFMGPMIYITDNNLKTIQLGLRIFIQQYGAMFGLLMAASMCALIPVVLVFLLMQKYFIQGIASTGVKG